MSPELVSRDDALVHIRRSGRGLELFAGAGFDGRHDSV